MIIIAPQLKLPKIFYRLILIIFILLSIGIWAAGYLYYERQKEYSKQKKQDKGNS